MSVRHIVPRVVRRVVPRAVPAPRVVTLDQAARLRRFHRSEIALHWSVVVPYLALGFSGLQLVAGRNLDLGWVSTATCVSIHKGAALALLVFPVLVLVCVSPGPIARTALEAFRWSPREVWWLHASVLKLFFPRVRLPLEGRFNAGQRVNLLQVVTLLPLLAASGLALWFVAPGVLVIRALHVLAGAISVALAAGHMYLALVHPTTRAARGAMWHGHVSEDYAARHHPRWYAQITNSTAARGAHARAPLVSKLFWLLLLVGAATGGGVRIGLVEWGRPTHCRGPGLGSSGADGRTPRTLHGGTTDTATTRPSFPGPRG